MNDKGNEWKNRSERFFWLKVKDRGKAHQMMNYFDSLLIANKNYIIN